MEIKGRRSILREMDISEYITRQDSFTNEITSIGKFQLRIQNNCTRIELDKQ